MPAIHDRGGWPDAGPIDRDSDHQLTDWEMRTDALVWLLSGSDKRIFRVDELRRAIESLDPDRYVSCLYYEKWAAALEALLIEKEILTRDEIETAIGELAPARG